MKEYDEVYESIYWFLAQRAQQIQFELGWKKRKKTGRERRQE